MGWKVLLQDRPVAYISLSEGKALVDIKLASLVEPCLLAYGIAVALGAEDTAYVPQRLTGYTVHPPSTLSEAQVVKAVSRCIEFVTGLRTEVEQVEKIYAVEVEEEKREKESEEEVLFEEQR